MNLLRVPPYDLERDFTPKDIGGLVLWLDFQRGACSDTAGTTPAGINDDVAFWRDYGPFGYHCVQSTAGSRPTMTAAGLSFNGTTDYLPVSRMTGKFTDGYCIIFTFALPDGQPPSIRVPLGALSPTPTRGYWDMLLFTSGAMRLQAYENSNQVLIQPVTFNDGQNATGIFSATATPGSLITGYYNGVQQGASASIASFTWANIATAITEAPFIGGRNVNGVLDSPTNITVASLLIYNRALAASELTQVHRYVGRQHGISVP